jgi:exodeoxyribonuclease V beta subunit
MSAMQSLALSLPLRGSQLIEASAGTGKTFTISALYVRLVLGHGGPDNGFGRPLLPPEILVVTFTDAATQELRERIRTRLAEAARHFRGELPTPDALLDELRGEYAEADWPACARRLDVAAQWMDEAAVSTIHSWCQRMLREHAFDSGSLFTQTLETDQSDLLAEVVRDYWREHFYPLDGAALQWVHERWQSPQHLLGRLRPLLGQSLGEPGADPETLIEQTLQERARKLAELKAPWGAWAEELRTLLDGACARKEVNGRRLQARWYNPWCDLLRDWAADVSAMDLALGTGFTRLTPDGLAEVWTSGSPFEHPCLHAMVQLQAALAALPDPDVALLRHALAWVEQRFEREKQQRAQMGFDDMLVRLDAALAGVNGERLAEVIRSQFPVALIDEFQDTDPLQYRIFQRIYRIGDAQDGNAILLIGDPKQAIYAFRGADIYTYLQAREATAGCHHSLGTNFRSSQGLVTAVNQLFGFAEAHAKGAFLFRGGDDNPLPFVAVDAKGRRERLLVDGAEQSPLTLWQQRSEEPLGGDAYRRELAARSASEITRLLSLGQQGRAGFAKPDEPLTPLCPADIAVLVRDGREARAIRQQLAQRGVRSVYLSDKNSVYDTQAAHDLLAWLKACAEPDDERLLRAALASATLDRPLAELEDLCDNELAWEQRVLQFRAYRQHWRWQGVLPMLRRLLQDFELPQTLIARDDGERVLTDLLHLAELLQQASGELDGEQALIRHLAEHLSGHGQDADEQILRLESDADLVKVVTIHKSKGLEYPLVFLPFICSHRAVDPKKPPLRYHDDQGRLQLDLQPDEAATERADFERLGEDLRLLYVALTRARHACWLGIADLKKGNGKTSCLHRSALGYVLGGGQPLALGAALQALAGACPALTLCDAPEASEQRFQPVQAETVSLRAATPRRRAAEHWWIASYSALALAGADETAPLQTEAPDSPAAQKIHDDDAERQEFSVLPGSLDLHRFPRGPQPGTFLHGILEWAGREGFAQSLDHPQARREMLAKRCQLRGWQRWIEPLDAWLEGYLQAELSLGEHRVRLADLQQYQVEMEFWFSSRQVNVQRLDALVRRHTLNGAPRPALAPSLLNGLFKGFIDLVFEHQGRYYVADYKSNWLGGDDEAYSAEAMAQAVLDKRYDLQYVLYLLALHRQLKARLPDYDYAQHMGGALYLFLRGGQRGVHVDCPPQALIESLDRLFAGHAETAL